MKKLLVVVVILLFLGSSIPALAKTQPFTSEIIPSIDISSTEDYKVCIGAGFFHSEGKFGLGYNMSVKNICDQNLSGIFRIKTTTFYNVKIREIERSFSVQPGYIRGLHGFLILNYPWIHLVYLTVQIENTTYSKSGYTIGPLVLLRG
jgi:hypothetical protein